MDVHRLMQISAKKDKRVQKLLQMLVDELNDKTYVQYIDEVVKLFSMFHNYSLLNYILMKVQYPDVELVAGIRKWNSLGRKVKKGEHGIAIFAPIKRMVQGTVYAVQYVDENGNVQIDEELTAKVFSNMLPSRRERVLNELIRNGELKYGDAYYGITKIETFNFQHVDRFTVVYVFDIKQTEICKKGEKCYKKNPFTLENAPTYRGAITNLEDEDFYKLMLDVANAITSGVYIEKFEGWKISAHKGYYSLITDTIHINQELSSFDRATVLIHETSHALIHRKFHFDIPRSMEEVVVETVAYIVTKLFTGIEYEPSKKYIALWLRNANATPEMLMNILDYVSPIVNEIWDTAKKVRGF